MYATQHPKGIPRIPIRYPTYTDALPHALLSAPRLPHTRTHNVPHTMCHTRCATNAVLRALGVYFPVYSHAAAGLKIRGLQYFAVFCSMLQNLVLQKHVVRSLLQQFVARRSCVKLV